jgi:hypothetical protein
MPPLAADATTLSATGLLPETTYFFRALITNETGDSAWSTTQSATTGAAIPRHARMSLGLGLGL